MKFKSLFLLLSSLSFLLSFQAVAHEGHEEHEVKLALDISDLRIKAPIPGQSISAGYMEVVNLTEEEVSIVRVSSRSASKIEIHTNKMEDGMMMMQQLSSVDIPGGETVSFTEGGFHLMVFDPDPAAIKAGTLRLVFELDNDYVIPVEAEVEHFMPQKDSMEQESAGNHEHH